MTIGEFRNCLSPSSCPVALSQQPQISGDPLPLPRLLKLISPSSPALLPEDVAMKAQDWAHPLQGQIQGSHWAAASERYSLRSEGADSS